MPGALAFWNEVFSQAAEHIRNNPELRQMIETASQKLDEENRRELSIIKWNATNETYLPEVIGAVAHRLFEIYALPSSGRVHSYAHKMFNDMYGSGS